MISGQDNKTVILIAPVSVTVATSATSYGYLDTIGWDACRFIYTQTIGTATGCAAKQFAIREGTNSTAATAIVALTGGTATAASVAFVCGALNTVIGVGLIMDVDLRKRARYLRCQVTPGEKAVPVVVAILSRGKVEPGADEATYIPTEIEG